MGCILYPPATLVNPLHRLHRLQQRRRPACTTQQPLFTCITTARTSSCRWRALFNQLSPTLPTTAPQATPTSRIAQQTPTRTIATTTAPTISKKTNNQRNLYHRKEIANLALARKRKPRKMERVTAVPSIVLSISVLALGAAIGSSSSSSSGCGGTHASAPSGALSTILGKGVGLGLGLNLSTLAPLLTLVWHAFTLLARRRTSNDVSYHQLHRAPSSPSAFSSASTADDNEPAFPRAARASGWGWGWGPHTLVVVWALNALLLLLLPRWTAATAFPHAALAVLSALEAGVLALAGVLARYHVQLALAGDIDDEYGWEHVDGGDDDGDDDDDEMKLAEI